MPCLSDVPRRRTRLRTPGRRYSYYLRLFHLFDKKRLLSTRISILPLPLYPLDYIHPYINLELYVQRAFKYNFKMKVSEMPKDKNWTILKENPSWVPRAPRKAAVAHFKLLTDHADSEISSAQNWYLQLTGLHSV
ncbi:hypothetical protein TNCV_366931 [Trichonephila clavipes]|nr:hypothetical protein TNCV_366931 [Trichonephila clavipes]